MDRRTTLFLLAGFAGWGCARRPVANIPWRLVPIASEQPIPVFVTPPQEGPPFLTDDTDRVWEALADWTAASDGYLRFVQSREAKARIRVYWRLAEPGRAGEMRTSARRGYRINDVLLGSIWAGLPEGLVDEVAGNPVLRRAIVYRMALHEIGHALGLVHTAGIDDAMYHGADPERYFRRFAGRMAGINGERPSGVSDMDRERLTQLYPGIGTAAVSEDGSPA